MATSFSFTRESWVVSFFHVLWDSFKPILIDHSSRIPFVLVHSHLLKWRDYVLFRLVYIHDSPFGIIVDDLIPVIHMSSSSPRHGLDFSFLLVKDSFRCVPFHLLVQPSEVRSLRLVNETLELLNAGLLLGTISEMLWVRLS